MISGFDGAIFDMDGTLLESMRYWRFTSVEYLLKHDLPVEPEDLCRMLDTSSRALVRQVSERNGIATSLKDVVREVEGYMDRHYQSDIHMKPFVPEFLQSLKDRGIRMCVATAVTRDIAVRSLEKQGIAHYFDFITDTTENGMDKDQVEYFHDVASRLGIPVGRCMVFEDALYSIRTAKKAGCSVCAIEDITARRQKEEITALADVYVKGYEELLH